MPPPFAPSFTVVAVLLNGVLQLAVGSRPNTRRIPRRIRQAGIYR